MRWTNVRWVLTSTIALGAATGCSGPSATAKLGEPEAGELGLGVQVGGAERDGHLRQFGPHPGRA